MSRNVAIFAFNGEPMCFIHVMLNALDMKDRGFEVKLVIEGTTPALLKELANPQNTFASLYAKTREADLIDCVCQACATKMGVLESVKEQGLSLCSEMSGHPSMGRYLNDGYEVLIF